MKPINRYLIIVLIVLGVIGTVIGVVYTMGNYENRYRGFGGGGICYHKPQDVTNHVIDAKPMSVYNQYWYS